MAIRRGEHGDYSKRPADAQRTAARQAAMNLRARQKGKVANDN